MPTVLVRAFQNGSAKVHPSHLSNAAAPCKVTGIQIHNEPRWTCICIWTIPSLCSEKVRQRKWNWEPARVHPQFLILGLWDDYSNTVSMYLCMYFLYVFTALRFKHVSMTTKTTRPVTGGTRSNIFLPTQQDPTFPLRSTCAAGIATICRLTTTLTGELVPKKAR